MSRKHDAPTFDENGHLATVVVDAKKLSELTDELVALRNQVADKTDKVNALWIENQKLLKQLNEAQRQAGALYERHKHLDAFLSDESLPPIGKTGSAILCELWGFVKRAANGEAS